MKVIIDDEELNFYISCNEFHMRNKEAFFNIRPGIFGNRCVLCKNQKCNKTYNAEEIITNKGVSFYKYTLCQRCYDRIKGMVIFTK